MFIKKSQKIQFTGWNKNLHAKYYFLKPIYILKEY